MVCIDENQKYNDIIQENLVQVFLDGLDDKLDNFPIDVL